VLRPASALVVVIVPGSDLTGTEGRQDLHNIQVGDRQYPDCEPAHGVKNGQIYSDLLRFTQIWSDLVRCGEESVKQKAEIGAQRDCGLQTGDWGLQTVVKN